MGNKAIEVENLGKAYQLGQIGTGTISRDIERWWITKVRGKEDPFLRIGETNDRTTKGDSDIVWSLKDINFSIEQGDAVGIIGRNGAGKSTLLKLLSRVTAPTTGNIKVKGRIASLLEVGTGFHPELSGRENIYLNGAILGMRKKEIDRKFDEIVDFSGVERYIDTPVKRYSSGMYVRLAFAVAAHLESEILIVDEVLAVGDAEFQQKCLGKMGEVSKGEGRTVLFVSHNMGAIESLCNQAILIENGLLKAQNEVRKVVDLYQSNSRKLIGQKDLSSIGRRYGSGLVKLTAVWIENAEGDVAETIRSGEKTTFCFEYECNNLDELKNWELGFSIHREDDSTMTVLYSSYQNVKFESKQDKGVIKCCIEDLPIGPGYYLVGVRILANGMESDWIKSMLTAFEVESGDFYKTGSLGFGIGAPLLLKGDWKNEN